jgi:3',5'-cyclic AMP phosphodiesterase CpdA
MVVYLQQITGRYALARTQRLLLFLCFLVVLSAAWLPAKSATDGRFTFVVMGDNRPNKAGSPQPKMFRRIVEEVNRLNPKFVIHTGDCILGSGKPEVVEEQWKEYLSVSDMLHRPVYHAVGNHEIDDSRANEELFRRLLHKPNLYYSFTYRDCYFAALDSEVVGETARVSGAQYEWLKNDLEASRDKAHKFLFIHRPLFPVDGHLGRCLDKHPNDRAKLMKLMKTYKVDCIFSGHEHLYNKSVVGGVKEYITGGAGAPLYPSLLGRGMYNHYLLVTVDGDYVDVKVIRPKSTKGSEAEQKRSD